MVGPINSAKFWLIPSFAFPSTSCAALTSWGNLLLYATLNVLSARRNNRHDIEISQGQLGEKVDRGTEIMSAIRVTSQKIINSVDHAIRDNPCGQRTGKIWQPGEKRQQRTSKNTRAKFIHREQWHSDRRNLSTNFTAVCPPHNNKKFRLRHKRRGDGLDLFCHGRCCCVTLIGPFRSNFQHGVGRRGRMVEHARFHDHPKGDVTAGPLTAGPLPPDLPEMCGAFAISFACDNLQILYWGWPIKEPLLTQVTLQDLTRGFSSFRRPLPRSAGRRPPVKQSSSQRLPRRISRIGSRRNRFPMTIADRGTGGRYTVSVIVRATSLCS